MPKTPKKSARLFDVEIVERSPAEEARVTEVARTALRVEQLLDDIQAIVECKTLRAPEDALEKLQAAERALMKVANDLTIRAADAALVFDHPAGAVVTLN